jgi:catechol 2,3-dioxygenase-like lactoylglutathione lyase family enzyme
VSGLRVERSNTILYCDHWSATAAFYRALLGDVVVFENDWFVELRVREGASLSIADAVRASIASSGGAGITLSWEVSDVVAERERLLADGFTVSVVRHRFGSPVVDLFDPEGHRVELWSR